MAATSRSPNGATRRSFFSGRPSAEEFYGLRFNLPQEEPTLDKRNIRHDPSFHSVESDRLIAIPDDYPDEVDFDVAVAKPAISFQVVQHLDPWYLPADDEIRVSPLSASGGFAMWSGFGAMRRGPDGCYYYSIGNHMYVGGNAYMFKYDPVAGTNAPCFDLATVCGWTGTEWSDGKIHGNPDLDSDGNMYVTGFSGPRPLAADLESVDYRGGHVIRYNVFSQEARDLGVPLSGDTWCYSAYQPEMGLLFAVGQAKHMIMAFDTRTERLVYGGFPPPGIEWWMRAILMDPVTGQVYSTNVADRARPLPFISWDPSGSRFRTFDLTTPQNPVNGHGEPLRAHTTRADRHGAYWCMDEFGFIFKFWPTEMRLEPVANNWGSQGLYTSNLVLSPNDRYLYYLPGAHSRAYEYGTPVVQFDTHSKRRKVIAFLNDALLEDYGYSPYGSYGLEISPDGESLIFFTNGLFSTKEQGSGYGRPALFHLHIPEQERAE